MILTTTSDIIRVVYGAATAVDLDFQTGWADQTTTAFTPGRTNTNGTTAGGATVTIVGSPAGSTQRQVKTITIRNAQATYGNTLTVQHFDGTTSVDVWSGTLLPSESVQYDGTKWNRLNSSGTIAVAGDTDVVTLTGIQSLSNKTLVAPALGTPASGVMTNVTGTAAGLTAGNVTTNANLTGHVTSVGNAAVLGAFTLAQLNTAVSDADVVTLAGTETLTNKRIKPRVVDAASYTTDTGTSLDVSTCDLFVITAQAGALLFNSPGGTPVQGQKLMIRIKDNATARALTWNAVFRAMGTALPSTTVLSKTLYLGFIYNSTDTKWDLVASAQAA